MDDEIGGMIINRVKDSKRTHYVCKTVNEFNNCFQKYVITRLVSGEIDSVGCDFNSKVMCTMYKNNKIVEKFIRM